MDLKENLRNYIIGQLVSGKNVKNWGDDDDLMEENILDSLAFVGLITHLEDAYKIEIETADMVAENFGSINRLTDFINRKMRNQ